MSRILKASDLAQSAALAHSADQFAFDDWGSASERTAAAQRAADELVAAARCEAEQIRAEAREAGLAAAQSEFNALVEQAAALRFEAWLPVLTAAAAEVTASKAAWFAKWEGAALSVATAIAGRVLRREIERTPEVALTLVRETLELATIGEAKLSMHPADIECLSTPLEALLAELGRTATVQLIPDSSISRGGCRLDTRLGTIDQQLEAQLARIEEELR